MSKFDKVDLEAGWKAYKDKTTFEEHHKKTLKRRFARLHRLIDLDAPGLILVDEFVRLRKLVLMLWPEELKNAEMKDEFAAFKPEWFCSKPECREKTSDVEPYPDLCETCKKDQLAFDKETDEWENDPATQEEMAQWEHDHNVEKEATRLARSIIRMSEEDNEPTSKN